MKNSIFFPFYELVHMASKRRASPHFNGILATILISLFIGATGYFLNYFLNMVLARLLHPAAYGDYSAAIAILQFCIIFVLLGSDAVVIKQLPPLIKKKRWGEAKGYLIENQRLIFITGLFMFSLGIIIAGSLLLLQHTNVVRHFEQFHPVIFFIWMIPFIAIMTFFSRLLRGLQKIFMSFVQSNNFIYIFIIFFILIAAWVFRGRLDIYHALFAYVFAVFLLIIVQFITVFFSLPKEIKTTTPVYPRGNWIRTSLELLLANFLLSNLTSLFLILLEIFGRSEEQVGVFSAILVVSNVLWIIYNITLAIVAVSISLLTQRRDRNQLQKVTNLANLTMMVVASLLVTNVVIFGKKLLSHFNPIFVSGYSDLIIATIGVFFVVSFGMVFPLLQYTGKQRVLIKNLVILFFPMIVGGSVLIYYFDLRGVAIALMLSEIIITISCGMSVKKELKLKPFFFF